MVPNSAVESKYSSSTHAISFPADLEVLGAPVLWEKRKAKAVEEQS